MSKNRKRAEELAGKLYTRIVFRDKVDEDEYAYIALNPELEGCIVQGDTLEEAKAYLDEVRIDLIEHLLDYELIVPEPSDNDMSILEPIVAESLNDEVPTSQPEDRVRRIHPQIETA